MRARLAPSVNSVDVWEQLLWEELPEALCIPITVMGLGAL